MYLVVLNAIMFGIGIPRGWQRGGGILCSVVGGELDVAWSTFIIIPDLVWYFSCFFFGRLVCGCAKDLVVVEGCNVQCG